ncbi:MAG: hypothetical protein EAZ55_07005 [Cytophagales bacterium]|nr:MAG: hypothetical protein EAZ55_07005 [Cytophagales bacterium]
MGKTSFVLTEYLLLNLIMIMQKKDTISINIIMLDRNKKIIIVLFFCFLITHNIFGQYSRPHITEMAGVSIFELTHIDSVAGRLYEKSNHRKLFITMERGGIYYIFYLSFIAKNIIVLEKYSEGQLLRKDTITLKEEEVPIFYKDHYGYYDVFDNNLICEATVILEYRDETNRGIGAYFTNNYYAYEDFEEEDKEKMLNLKILLDKILEIDKKKMRDSIH